MSETIEGVYIDARRADETKENPKVTFYYETGYESLANATNQRQIVTRSFATGGKRKTAQAQKRHRPADLDIAPGTTGDTEEIQQQPIFLSMQDLETPANLKKKQGAVQSTPAARQQGQAGTSTLISPPYNDNFEAIQDSPAPHLSHYYGGPSGSPNPPPPPPEEEGE